MSRTWFELENDQTVSVWYQIEDNIVQRGIIYITPEGRVAVPGTLAVYTDRMWPGEPEAKA